MQIIKCPTPPRQRDKSATTYATRWVARVSGVAALLTCSLITSCQLPTGTTSWHIGVEWSPTSDSHESATSSSSAPRATPAKLIRTGS